MSSPEITEAIRAELRDIVLALDANIPGRLTEVQAARFINRPVAYLRALRDTDTAALTLNAEAELRGPRWYFAPGARSPWYDTQDLKEWLAAQRAAGRREPQS